MKKSLVLAAMALGVTASAYAANPFSDVPAGHWAYDSIDKLAAAGVIEGYGDGTYRGAQNITRYEMAQMVAKAMAKGANVEKLAAEFADELDALGVRVAKLEKKADNVTITGQIRYEDESIKIANAKDHHATHRLRTRLFVNGQINEDWAYHARIENNATFNGANGGKAGNDLKMNQAYVTGKLGGLGISAGRTPVAKAQSFVWDDQMDGVVATYGKSIQLKGFAGDVDTDSNGSNWGHIKGAEVSAKLGVVATSVGYTNYEFGRYGTEAKNNIWDATVSVPMGKSLKLNGQYIHASKDGDKGSDKDGWLVGLGYKGAKAAKVGSWGLSAKWYHVGAYNWIVAADKIDNQTDQYIGEGFKGYQVGGNVTLAKNMVASVDWTEVKGRVNDVKTKQLWSRLQMTF